MERMRNYLSQEQNICFGIVTRMNEVSDYVIAAILFKGKASIVMRDTQVIASLGLSLCYLVISDFNQFIYFRF